MRTREEQIIHAAQELISHRASGKSTEYYLVESIVDEAERRAEQRVRAEIGRDSDRLDWIGTQDVVIGEYGGQKWKEVLLSRYQISLPADLVDIRITIDAAREVG